MENNSNNSNGSGNLADVRAASVARLKRATSLPRMKDGRRPAVNGGEKPSASDGDRPDTKSSTGTVTPAPEDPATPQPSTPNYDQADEEDEGFEETTARTPTPPQLVVDEEPPSQQPAEPAEPVPSRGRRRSRPNSRNHSRANTPRLEAQLPAPPGNNHIPSSLASASPTALPARALPPNSVASHLTAGATAALNLNLRAPPPPPFLSPVSPFLPTTTPPPSLEVLQGNYIAGIFRSKSVGRAHALAKLTGGSVTPESEYFTPFMNSTPPSATVPSRSNTVSGGERNAARLAMMQKLRTRVNNTDNEAQSGAEEVFTAPAILEREREKKKRRRRSHRRSGSTSTNNNQTTDERDFSSAQTTPATTPAPLPPPQPTPATPARLYQLSDADVLIQEERQRAYYQHQRGGPFIEDEDEPPTPRDEEEPVHPILAPRVSPSFTQVTTPERSIDGGEQHNGSSAESWQSSAETEVGETASARVPVVMESARSPYGRQVREAFPVTAYDAATRDPSDPGDQAETDDFDSAPLALPPRAPWNGQSSASWIVDSPRTRRFLLIRAIIY